VCVCVRVRAHVQASMYEEGDKVAYISSFKISLLVCFNFVVPKKCRAHVEEVLLPIILP